MTDTGSEKENGAAPTAAHDLTLDSSGSVSVTFTDVRDFGLSQSHARSNGTKGASGQGTSLALQLDVIRNLMGESKAKGAAAGSPPPPPKAFLASMQGSPCGSPRGAPPAYQMRHVTAQPATPPPADTERTIVRQITAGQASQGSGASSLETSARKVELPSTKDLKAMMAALSAARAQKGVEGGLEGAAAAPGSVTRVVRRAQVAGAADGIPSVASLDSSAGHSDALSVPAAGTTQRAPSTPVSKLTAPGHPRDNDLTTPQQTHRPMDRDVFVNPLYVNNFPEGSPQSSAASSRRSSSNAVYQPKLYRTNSGSSGAVAPSASGSGIPLGSQLSFGMIPKMPPRRKPGSESEGVGLPEPPAASREGTQTQTHMHMRQPSLPRGASVKFSDVEILAPAPPGLESDVRPRRNGQPVKLDPLDAGMLERAKSVGVGASSSAAPVNGAGGPPKAIRSIDDDDEDDEELNGEEYDDFSDGEAEGPDAAGYGGGGRGRVARKLNLGTSGHLADLLKKNGTRPVSTRLARETARLRAQGVYAQDPAVEVEIDHETMTVRPKIHAPEVAPKASAALDKARARESIADREAREAAEEAEHADVDRHRRRHSSQCAGGSESDAPHGPGADMFSAPGDLQGRDFDGFSVSPPSTAGRSDGYGPSQQKLTIKGRGPRWTIVKSELDDPRPAPVAGHAMACVDHRWVITCLGVNGDSGKNMDGERVCAYEVATKQWLPVALEGEIPPPLAYVTAVEVKPYELDGPLVLVFGGWLGGAECSQELFVLEGFAELGPERPRLDLAWTKPSTVGPTPPPRSHHSATVVRGGLGIDIGECSDPHVIRDPETHALVKLPRQHMIVFGGWSPQSKQAFRPMGPNAHLRAASQKASSSGSFLADIHALDVDTLEWIRIIPHGGSSPSPRGSHCAFTHGRGLYIWGGQGDQGPMADMWCLDLKRLQWQRIVQKGYVPSPRSGHTAAVIGNRVVLFGGTDGSKALDDLYVLHMSTLTWTRVDTITRGATPRAVMGHAMCVLGTERIFTLGGLGRDAGAKEPVYRRDAWVLDVSQPQIDNVHLRPSGNTGSPYEALLQRLYDPVYDPLSEKRGPVKVEYKWHRRKGTKGLWLPIPNAASDRYTPNLDDVGYMIGICISEVQEEEDVPTGVSHFEYGALLVELDPLVDKVAREYLVNKRCEFTVNVAVRDNTAVERGLLVLTDAYVRLKGGTSIDFKVPWPRQFKATLMASSPFAFGMRLGGNEGDVYFSVAQTIERDLVVSTARAFWSLTYRISKPLIAEVPYQDKPMKEKLAEAGPIFAANAKMEFDAQISKVQDWIGSIPSAPVPPTRPRRKPAASLQGPENEAVEEEEEDEEAPEAPAQRVLGQYRGATVQPPPQTSFLQQLVEMEAAVPLKPGKSSKATVAPEPTIEATAAAPRALSPARAANGSAVAAKKLPGFRPGSGGPGAAEPLAGRPGSSRALAGALTGTLAAVHPQPATHEPVAARPLSSVRPPPPMPPSASASPSPPAAPPPDRGVSERRQAALASPHAASFIIASNAAAPMRATEGATRGGQGADPAAILGPSGSRRALFSSPSMGGGVANEGSESGASATGLFSLGVGLRREQQQQLQLQQRRDAEDEGEVEADAVMRTAPTATDENNRSLNSSLAQPRLRYLAYQNQKGGAGVGAVHGPPASSAAEGAEEDEEREFLSRVG